MVVLRRQSRWWLRVDDLNGGSPRRGWTSRDAGSPQIKRCIGGDGALSRWRRSLPSFSSIRCIGGDGALLDGDVGGVRRRVHLVEGTRRRKLKAEEYIWSSRYK
ncbi:hypothetical protein YC2023_044126 [Brassica napus]